MPLGSRTLARVGERYGQRVSSTLSGEFAASEPGLPRGRGRMDADSVQAAQRSRLLRAVVASIAESGYHDATIADIVRRARVSRGAFYALFASKQECLLAAVERGREHLLGSLGEAPAPAGGEGVADVLEERLGRYLEISAAEPEFTYVWTIELPQAGAAGMALRNAYLDDLTALVADLHRSLVVPARALADDDYLAVVAGCHEIFYRHVAAGGAATLADLLPRMVRLALGLLPH